MNPFTDIYTASINAFSRSVPLKEWLEAHPPSTRLFCYDGVLPESLPEESLAYPIIAFSSVDNIKRGDESRDNEFLLRLSVAVKDDRKFGGTFFEETLIELDEDEPKIVVPITSRKLPGKETVLEFWKLVTEEILALKGLYCKINTEGQTLLEEAYPIFKFSGDLLFIFKKENRSGSRL